ncbi:hypothetical protein CKO40_14515 [Halochromatium glycolicum]|uniref:Sigma E regulatory protein, MucB/RseB n=2 Tax=Halochromatium glycolicum TaxID=85075 RepID=A0AAJ0XAW0_9GAMM|nr:hypothetical protein [Halochromatium glycolicum]
MRLWLVKVACVKRMRGAALHRVTAGLVFVGFGLALAAASAADQQVGSNDYSPVDWLARMARALTKLEYEGTLVYLHGHELSTLRIAHRIENGQPRESLLALSGPIRAVARSHQRVTCVLPDARAISVPRHPPHSAATLHPGPLEIERLQPHYLIHPLGRSRVAGRDTRVIGIIPKDDLRYGYRFFIDEATGLPLKTDLMNSAATPIEQVMFTEVDFLEQGDEPPALGAAPAPSAVLAQAGPDGGDGADMSASRLRAESALTRSDVRAGPWTFAELPAGYRVTAGDSVDLDGEHARRWFMITDGLSAVSVYIEPDRGQGFAGTKRIGAVNAAGRILDHHQVTVVGEVPLQTVQAIAEAVTVNEGPAH